MFSRREERCMSSASGRIPTYLLILAGGVASAGAGAVVVWRVREARAVVEEARRKAEGCFGEGKALFGEGRYGEAIEKLKEALEYQPDLAKASQLIDRASEQLEELEKQKKKLAADRKKREEKAKQNALKHDFLLKTARKMLELGQMDEALKAVLEARDLVRGSPEAGQLLDEIENAKAKAAQKDADRKMQDELDEQKRKLQEQHTRMAHDLHLRNARLLLKKGDPEAAKEFATEALKHVPDSPEAKNLLAEIEKKIEEDRQRKREVEDEAKRARERATFRHDMAIMAAEEALEGGALALAEKYWEVAVEADPESEEAEALGKRIKKAKTAEKDRREKQEFERALTVTKYDSALKSAREFLADGDFEAAKKLALQALEALPESIEARKLYEEILTREKAAASAAEAEKKRRHDEAVAKARVELAADRFDSARAQADIALKLVPGSPEALDIIKQIAASAAAARRPEESRRTDQLLEVSRTFRDRSLLDGAEYFATKVLMEAPQNGPAHAMLQEIRSERLKRERETSEKRLQEMIRKMEEEKEKARKAFDEGLQRSEEERRKAQKELEGKTDDLKDLRDDLEKLIRGARRGGEAAPLTVVNVGSPGVKAGSGQVAALVVKGYENLARNDLDQAEAAGNAALHLRPGYEPAETLLEEVRKRRAPTHPTPAGVTPGAAAFVPSADILARFDSALEGEDLDGLSKLLGETLAARELENAKEFFSLASEIKVKRTKITPVPSALRSDWTISYVLEGERVSSALSTEYTVARRGEEDHIIAVRDLR